MSEKIQLPESLEGKTAIVAGAAGFVPSTLAEKYLKLGARVIGLDNFVTGSKSNIEILSKYENFDFHECNIYEGLPGFKGLDVDYVFSLASPASPIDFSTLPLEIMRVNSEGTLALLESPKTRERVFLKPQLPKFMETQKFTLRLKIMLGMLIQLDLVLVTMSPNDSLKH